MRRFYYFFMSGLLSKVFNFVTDAMSDCFICFQLRCCGCQPLLLCRFRKNLFSLNYKNLGMNFYQLVQSKMMHHLNIYKIEMHVIHIKFLETCMYIADC